MKFFQNTMAELEKVSEVLHYFEEQAIALGIPVEHTSLTNIVQKCDKVFRDALRYNDQAKSIGYTSLAHALKALSQMKIEEESDISKLPEVFHKPPYIWVKGREPNHKKKLEGLVPMGVKNAERKHKMIAPLLAEAWKLAETEENWEVQKNIILSYQNKSAKEFEADLYTYINYLEPLTLEEELEEIKNPTKITLDEEALLVLLKKEIMS